MMIQHLAVTTHNVVKAERKPRRNIQYRDVSGAVSKTDNLEFLVDVVPKTTQYGAFRKKRAAEEEERLREGEKEKEKVEEKAKGKGKGRVGERSKGQTALGGGEAHEVVAQGEKATAVDAPRNGVLLEPLAREELVPAVPETETEAMDVDGGVDEERVADSEEGEGDEDPAAMQIEMEMRGPPRQNAKGKAKEESAAAAPPPPPPPPPRASTGGFTPINGR